MRRMFWIILLSLVTLVAGFFLGHSIFPEDNPQGVILKKISPQNISFKFIKPLLAIELTTDHGFLNDLQPIIKKIRKNFDQEKIHKDIQSISYYYFDLASSRWAGFAEDDQFNPASLYKVPIMLAYFKKAESKPDLLNKKITLSKASSSILFSPEDLESSSIKIDQAYTIDELIKTMIINSDNVAKNLLINFLQEQPSLINWQDLNNIFSYLGININNNRDKDLVISARTFSIFFRLLYNGNYLNYDYSEKALELLSQADFKNGIAAGVPKNIVVANKFGLYDTDEQGNALTPELHDCGIVYHPQRPYLLCIMTKGSDVDKLKEALSSFSKITYDFVENNL
jgi:beta-lactamase class A